MSGLLIVGGSYAALNIAVSARQNGYAEPIRIATDEAFQPYHRPPLSKAYLTGTVGADTLPLRNEAFYVDHRIDVMTNMHVERIELPGRAVTQTGVLDFDVVAIATGTRARHLPLPGAALDGVVSLRSLADAQALAALLPRVHRVVIIGGGFIGLELAATFIKLGREVTILETQGRLLSRVTFPLMSAFLESQHLHHGVRILCSKAVEAIEGVARAEAVRTADGTRHEADLVIMAAGAVPNTELLDGTGLAGANGVEVDESGRTRAPNVYAAGDCALYFSHFANMQLRLESVQNATDQGKSVGAAIAGKPAPYRAVPWFWSDQFDLKLQMVGLSAGATAELVRGSVEERKFSIFYLKDGHLVGIDSVNSPAEHMLGRRILAAKPQVSAEKLADRSFDLKSLL